MDADFLLTRGADLAVLGVRLRGFHLEGDSLEAMAEDGARIILHLPPQHAAEGTTKQVEEGLITWAQLAGPSRVAYEVAEGTSVRLDAEGILAACTTLAQAATPAGPADTAIELPWRLAFAPWVEAGTQVEHAPGALRSAEGVVGLWLSRLRGAGQGSPPGELGLLPVDSGLANSQDPPGVGLALSRDHRTTIAANGLAAPPHTDKLELTALGGSLAAHGEWPGFRWSQRATLGRDQAVVVVEQMRIFPFGQPVIQTTTSVRDPDAALTPGGQTVPPGGTLTLRRVRTLKIPKPVIHSVGPVFDRSFPFSSVELTTTSFTGLGDPQVGYQYERPTPALETLRENRQTAETAAGELEAQWLPETAPRTIEDLLRIGFGPALRWQSLASTLGPFEAEFAELDPAVQQANALAGPLEAAQRNLEQLEHSQFPGPEGGPSPEIAAAREAVNSLFAQIRELGANFARHAFVSGEIGRLTPQANAAFSECEPLLGQTRTVEDLVREGNQAAIQWLAKKQEIAALDWQIEELKSLATTDAVFVWPKTTEGELLQFPVRLRSGEQAFDVTMPLILIKDFVLRAQASLPEYVSLEDPELPHRLSEAWGPTGGEEEGAADMSGPGAVEVPGILLDVVGSANPRPEDVQVVRALNILGPSSDDLFSPTLGRAAEDGQEQQWAMRIDLPAVRTLLGEATADDSRLSTAVSFASDYLEKGEAAELLFDAVEEIGVDFTSMADRSGGLTALQLAADGISRASGPVQAAALTSSDPAKAVGDAATLLGFKLQDLLSFETEDAQEPKQITPQIVSDLVEGRPPVVRMEWKDMALKDFLALRTFPTEKEPGRRSLLTLEVLSAPDRVETSCNVRDFMLAFPPGSKPLLQLTFGKLAYAQQTTGGAAAPPRVDIEGFDVEFLGPLALLKKLQDAADLLGSAPSLRPTPSGVSATFTVPVPSVQCAAFSLSNLVFRSGVEVPFSGDPVSVAVGFASRSAPFAVSVLAFSGGGYIDIRIDAKGPRIEASLEFGAAMSVDFLVARGEIHALGGVRYVQQGSSVELTGYIRIGGSVEVLGLVSASIELVVQLSYRSELNRLEGRAKLVLELDLTLWSDSVEIDSGPWVLQGDDSATPAERVLPARGPNLGESFLRTPIAGAQLDDDAVFEAIEAQPSAEELAAWRSYRQAFTGGVATGGDER